MGRRLSSEDPLRCAKARGPGGKFGLLVINGVMPSCPRSRLIEQALAQNPDCRSILSSAYTSHELVLRGIGRGAFHSLAKPFDANRHRQAVNTVLGYSR
jgi:DNA-binding NtrC family response regulator